MGRQHRGERPLHLDAAVDRLGREGARERDRPDEAGRRQPAQVLGAVALTRVDRPLQDRSRERMGEERARHAGAAELLGHHHELRESGTLARVLLGDMQPQPTLRREGLPERRERLGLLVERRPQHRRRAMPVHPTPDRSVQLLVLVTDPDRHGMIVRTDLTDRQIEASTVVSERSTPMVDLVVTGGTVVDGTGAPPRIADVAVTDGIVTEIADAGSMAGTGAPPHDRRRRPARHPRVRRHPHALRRSDHLGPAAHTDLLARRDHRGVRQLRRRLRAGRGPTSTTGSSA